MERRAWLWVLAAATLLSLPALSSGFFNDDFIHRLALSSVADGYRRGPFTLYDFLRDGRENAALVNAGLLPWFTDPELTVRFFRPLSSLLVALDVSLFGEQALPAHLHSFAWFLAAIALVWNIQRALLPARAAVWATFVFAVASAHAETTSWIAARHVLASGVLGLLAWYAEILRQKLDRPELALAGAAALVVALFASEAALPAVPFVIGQAWFGTHGSSKQRIARVLPTALITFVYLVLYDLGGYGTHDNGSYVSPFDSPLRFLGVVAENVPLLASELFAAAPSGLSYAGDTARRVLWVIGVVSVALVATFAVRRARTLDGAAPHLAWIPLSTAASLVPVSGTIIDGRVLLVPLVGSSALVGFLLSRVGSRPSPRAVVRLASAAGLVLLAVLHLGLAPVIRVVIASRHKDLGRIQNELPGRAKLACAPGARLLVINGSDPTIGMYIAPILLRAEGFVRPGFHVLSMAQNDVELERSGERSFVLRTIGERRGHVIEELFRPRQHALRVGDAVRLEALTATVLATSEQGPTEVRFDLDSEPNAPTNCLAQWLGGADGHLESVSLPAAGALRVRYAPGPMGM